MTKRKKQKNAIRWIILTGLLTASLVGITSIILFTLKYGKEPSKYFKFIASTVFGEKAFVLGFDMIFYGMLFYLVITFAFTIFYFLIYLWIKFLSQNIFLSGIFYGVFIWAVISLILIPLSNAPVFTLKPEHTFLSMLILIACGGIPVSFFAHKYFEQNKPK